MNNILLDDNNTFQSQYNAIYLLKECQFVLNNLNPTNVFDEYDKIELLEKIEEVLKSNH